MLVFVIGSAGRERDESDVGILTTTACRTHRSDNLHGLDEHLVAVDDFHVGTAARTKQYQILKDELRAAGAAYGSSGWHVDAKICTFEYRPARDEFKAESNRVDTDAGQLPDLQSDARDVRIPGRLSDLVDDALRYPKLMQRSLFPTQSGIVSDVSAVSERRGRDLPSSSCRASTSSVTPHDGV